MVYVRYRIKVEEKMRVWKVVPGEPQEIEPLESGEYDFLRVQGPFEGFWVALEAPFKKGEVIGRTVFSTAVHYAETEGFRIVSEYNTGDLASCGR